jgi:hypothetical protein
MLRPKSFEDADQLAREFELLEQGMAMPNEKEVRQQASDAVSKDVRKNDLIDNKRFNEHTPKSQGMFPGCIFHGVNKAGNPKKVFVKHYAAANIFGDNIDSQHDSLIDYAVFRILKHCGARAPKVRFKASLQTQGYNYYLFSTDITHPRKKHQNKSYWYGDIEGKLVKYHADKHMLSSRVELLPKKPVSDDVNEFKKAFHKYDIDNRSAARLLLLGLILQLNDLHVQNVGFVLSRKDDVVKAKPVFIDFYVSPTKLNIKPDSLLNNLLMDHFNKDDAIEVIRELIANIPQEEFLQAMKDIEKADFVEICNSLLNEVNGMKDVTPEMKRDFKERIEVIKTNFLHLCAHLGISHVKEKEAERAPVREKKCIIC